MLLADNNLIRRSVTITRCEMSLNALILPRERKGQFLHVAQWILLPVRQRRQLRWRDEDRVLAALGFINLYQPGLLRPVAVHLQNRTHKHEPCNTELRFYGL